MTSRYDIVTRGNTTHQYLKEIVGPMPFCNVLGSSARSALVVGTYQLTKSTAISTETPENNNLFLIIEFKTVTPRPKRRNSTV